MAQGKPSACVNVSMDAVFKFICVCACVWVAHLFVYAFLMKAALMWMNSSVVTLIMQGCNQSASREPAQL